MSLQHQTKNKKSLGEFTTKKKGRKKFLGGNFGFENILSFL